MPPKPTESQLAVLEAKKEQAKLAKEAQALSRQNHNTALKSVDVFAGGDDAYAKFRRQVLDLGFTFEWHPSILDHTIEAPDEAKDFKYKYDKLFAYALLKIKIVDTELEAVVEGVEQGDATTAFHLCHTHFHRDSMAGCQEATRSFYNATMESTHTNIVEWGALVTRRSQTLIQAGGQCSENAILLQYLAGLRMEFNTIKTIIEDASTMTLPKARAKLHD
jgi:hypothetical protein